MDPREREEAIFQAAIRLDAGGRDEFLKAACGDNTELRQRLEALLAAQDRETALGHASMRSPRSPEEEPPLPPFQIAGSAVFIGPYKVREKLGEGGWGVVYVADQETPVRRRVALKVLKLGMDTRQVIARFEAERQALAMMDHSNIAKVLDAGETETGRPYFAMELVRGVPITEYCDTHQLSMDERIELFIQVCHAVQHAHQKGIIHRDLKPSNILVTLQENKPIPKVIDFGIAKATEGRLTEATVYTQLHQFIGTPAYMSPEQAEMTGLDIDTRSDIYSLGVLLYELLAGRPPFASEELLSIGIDEMRRTIREKEPVRPSTRLASLKLEEQTTTAKRRRSDAPKLIHLLKGDLDWIVMKCLEKDRTRRFETANALAVDLQRHLANEPVTARPPSLRYRLHKAWRRRKWIITSAIAVTIVLIAASSISILLALRAARAEEDSEAVTNFLIGVFQSPDPERDGRTITVAETLDSAARRLDSDMDQAPRRRAQLQGSLGTAYFLLGLPRPAIPLLEKARDYYFTAYGEAHPGTLAAMNNLANCYETIGMGEKALKLSEQIMAAQLKATGPSHPDTLSAMHNLAISYRIAGRVKEAIALQEQVVSARKAQHGESDPRTLGSMESLANSYFDSGRRREALEFREAILTRVRNMEDPEKNSRLVNAVLNLADSYSVSNRQQDALDLRQEGLARSQQTHGPEHPTTLAAMQSIANSYLGLREFEKAGTLLESTLDLRRKVNGPEHPETIRALLNLAEAYFAMQRRTEALSIRENCLALSQKINGPEHPDTLWSMRCLASSYSAAQRHPEAIDLALRTVNASRQVLGPDHPDTQLAVDELAATYLAAGRPGDADKLRQ